MMRQIAIDYIKKTRVSGFSDAVLRRELEKSGWPASEIDLAFIESRATDQKPAVEPPPAQSASRAQPQWEEKNTQTVAGQPKPIDFTKSSFAQPVSLGVPTGTITAPRITQVQKITITPGNELAEPTHLKELPRMGTPDVAKTISLDTKISELKKPTPEPLIMGVSESQLIKPLPRAETAKIEQPKIVTPQPEIKPESTLPPRFKPMQEEVVSNLIEGGLASARVSSSVAHSPVLESIGVPPRTRSHRVLAGVLVTIFFLSASGAAAGFWYYQTALKPQAIVKSALLEAQGMKSYTYDAELKMKIRESEATLGRAVRPFIPPLAGFALGAMTAGDTVSDIDMNYSFTMRAKGAVDMHDLEKPKSETTFTLGTKDFITPGFPSSNTEFESKLVDDTYYFQITKLPYFDSATVDPSIPRFTSADITGRWVSINFDTFETDFNNYVKELSELEPSFVGYHLDFNERQDLITEKQTKDIEKLWEETRLVVWSDEIVREQENGTDRYRIKGSFDEDSFKRFVMQAMRMTGGLTGQENEENQKSTEELFSQIGNVEVNAWVDKNSGKLVRFVVSATSSLPEEVGKEGVIEFNLTTELSDIDKPISIAAPADHYDVRKLLENLFAYARQGFASDNADARDARRLSDLSRMRTALELYKKREGSYPVKLSELVSEYMATLPADPLTKKQYRYTRSAKGYLLSADIEDKKNPILKRDANPANTLYDIGPAL
ncbi:MAG: hypothetical protein AAB417_03760 [Patescibacteria group bacterium]